MKHAHHMREKITTVLTQKNLDTHAKRALAKGGGKQVAKQERVKRDAERAEVASYRLNKRDKF